MKVELKLKEKNVTIWRYLTLEKFLDLFAPGGPRLFLCRLDKLHDAYEKSYNINQLRYLDSNGLSNNINESQQQFRERIYINSWNISKNELYSLWKTYVGEQIYGVAIKSTPQKIKESIEAIRTNQSRNEVVYIDKVNYNSKLSDNVNIHSFTLSKESFYTTEEELRIYTESSNANIVIPININILIDEIIISPFIADYAKTYFRDLVYNYSKKYEILTNKIKYSKLLFNKF